MREVHDQASPDHSHETDEMSGVDLTQEERRLNSVGLGMSVDVGNRLDVRKGKGQRRVGSGMHRQDARESEVQECVAKMQGSQRFRSVLLRCKLAWDGARGFGIGIRCSGMILMTRE